jgi:hypothetical protein
MDVEHWMMVVRAARERAGVVTSDSLREATLDTGLAAELLAERAATLSRLGNRLDAAVARLAALREQAKALTDVDPLREADAAARRELGEARWELQVVKEAMGLRGVRAELDRHWPLPPPLEPGR